jgi:hypothetical protein
MDVMDATEPEMLTVAQLAVRIGRSPDNVRLHLRRGDFPAELPAVQVGGRAMFRRSDVDRFTGTRRFEGDSTRWRRRPAPGDVVTDSYGDERQIVAVEAVSTDLAGDELVLLDADGDCIIVPDPARRRRS